jgi:carbamoyl-phosphate synthase small subunit
MKISLQLNTGQKFDGKSFGKEITSEEYGEIVFQTGMVGYPESLTDPSYLNQILVLSYPLIGNYGISEPVYDEHGIDKIFESNNIHIKALIVGEYNPKYSHWRGKKSLGDWLKEKGIIGISGVDTRELVKIIRENKDVIGQITNDTIEYKNKSIINKLSTLTIKDISETTTPESVSLKTDLFGQQNNLNKIIINNNPDQTQS